MKESLHLVCVDHSETSYCIFRSLLFFPHLYHAVYSARDLCQGCMTLRCDMPDFCAFKAPGMARGIPPQRHPTGNGLEEFIHATCTLRSLSYCHQSAQGCDVSVSFGKPAASCTLAMLGLGVSSPGAQPAGPTSVATHTTQSILTLASVCILWGFVLLSPHAAPPPHSPVPIVTCPPLPLGVPRQESSFSVLVLPVELTRQTWWSVS